MNLIGLENEAEEILENYKYQMENFDTRLMHVEINPIYYPYKVLCGAVYGIFGLFSISMPFDLISDDEKLAGLTVIVFVGWIPTYGLSKWYKSIKKENFQKVSYSEISPQINQVLSHAQIKSMAEAYNRKLFNEIKNK